MVDCKKCMLYEHCENWQKHDGECESYTPKKEMKLDEKDGEIYKFSKLED